MNFLETSCLHDLTFTTLTLGILVITILTVTISFTIPKPLCEHYIMGPFFLILQSLLIHILTATSTACFKVNSSSYNNVLSIIFNVP